MAVLTTMGRAFGSMMRQKMTLLLAPSSVAASSNALGMVSKKPLAMW